MEKEWVVCRSLIFRRKNSSNIKEKIRAPGIMICEKRSVLYPDYRHESYPGMNDEIFRFFCET